MLSTCNRSELYGVSPISSNDVQSVMERLLADFHGLAPAELDGRVYRENNTEAVRHLFRVASGLDSMLLGEAEILGQVREAYGRALEHGSTGPVLNRLFQSALEVGKRVRTETEVGTRPMSVAWAGVKLAEQVFGDLEGHEAVIIGAGAVAEKVVEHLRDRGIGRLVVVNRSRERAEDLARRMGGESADWATLETRACAGRHYRYVGERGGRDHESDARTGARGSWRAGALCCGFGCAAECGARGSQPL